MSTKRYITLKEKIRIMKEEDKIRKAIKKRLSYNIPKVGTLPPPPL